MATSSPRGFVVDLDEGEPYWFLNTLTINKIGGAHTHGGMSVVEHRMPAGFAPPPHVHHGTDEALYVIDGQIAGFCGDTEWRAGPGSIVFLPRDVPHGFHVPPDAPATALIMVAPAGFDAFVAALGNVPTSLTLPVPADPDPARVVAIAAAHGITILPPPS